MMEMARLLDELERHHHPEPPATPEEIAAFERRMGWRLDEDLRAFYLRCNGAELFERVNTPYRFLPLAEIVRGREFIYGRDEDADETASWYAICRVLDGNCIIVDVGDSQRGYYPIIDGFHEAYGDPVFCKRIAARFSDFLEGALNSQGRQFWL